MTPWGVGEPAIRVVNSSTKSGSKTSTKSGTKSFDATQGPRTKGMGSVHPKCRCQTRASPQGNGFSPSQVSMPNKGLVPSESVQVIPSDAKQGPCPKGISSGYPKCRYKTRASSLQGNRFSPSQVSMLNKGLVPSVSVQVISSVDAKQGPCPKGISSGYPKCRCQTRASSQGNQFRLSQVSMPNKGLVLRESIQASPSVNHKQGPRLKGISLVHPKLSPRVVLLIYSSLSITAKSFPLWVCPLFDTTYED